MNDKFYSFLDKTLNDIDEMYNNDEFRDGYSEAVETLKNAILNYFEENNPDLECRIIECDSDYDDITNVYEYICEELKNHTLIDYCTTSWNLSSYFCIMLIKKDK